MKEDKIEVFVTVDQNLTHQQNLKKFSVIIFILSAVDNRRRTLQLLIPTLLAILEKNNFNKVIEISREGIRIIL